MDRSSFNFVLAQIEDHEIFIGGKGSFQAPVPNQLAIALRRLGSNGVGDAIRFDAGLWGASEGHIFNCTRRVVTALASLAATWVRWPDSAARQSESNDADRRSGLKGVVGKLDGTDIVLYERPGGSLNGDEFFNRKRRYAINLTAICDRSMLFTYMLVGWPGSVHDSRAWSVSAPRRNPERFFDEDQFLLADSAYKNTDTLVTPYKKPLSNLLPNRRFNHLLSSVRIDIEHAFGLLKGRWASLKSLRLRLDGWDDVDQPREEEEDQAVEGSVEAENEARRRKVQRRALRRMYHCT
ncbi:hypothetical protein CF328_g8556 [Tilletia controversa]|nr:hypothetical protein CF328_g8556 [Tilletia controversa]